jgi:hypothetical protein
MNALTAISRAGPGPTGAVKAVSVISTGTVRIRPEHPYGSRKTLYWWLLTSRRWTPLPTWTPRSCPTCTRTTSAGWPN